MKSFKFLRGNNKMTFTQDQQHSPVLDPLNSQASHSLNSIQGKRDEEDGNSDDNEGSDSSEPATTTQLIQHLSPQKRATNCHNTDTSTPFQTSPNKKKLQKKLWEVTSEIFLKNLTEIQQFYHTQQSSELHHHSIQLKQRILKFSRESLGLLRMALKNSPSVGSGEHPHLELANYFIAAQDILVKDQSCYPEAIANAESALRLVETYPELAALENVKHFELSFAHILLKCGLLKKAERCLVSLTMKCKETDQGESYEQRLLCLKIEYQRLLGQKVTDKFEEIEDLPYLDGLFLRLNLLIDGEQLEKATFMIFQSLVVFKQPLIVLSLKNLLLKIYLLQNQFTEFHRLMGEMRHLYRDNNLAKTIEFCNAFIVESQCLLVEAELETIENKHKMCQEENIKTPKQYSTIVESKLKSALLVIDEADEVARQILSNQYDQSSISGDIYQLKATILMELSGFQTHKKDKSKILKQALSLCQLAIQLRQNYLFSHCDKNSKVLESLHLQVDLLSLTNRSRECRKASAELLEYELV